MRRALAVLGLALALVTVSAGPAAAHGVGGREPTNVVSRIVSIDPPVDGVSVQVVEFDTKLELRNESATPVVVFGYDAEPYLRVDERGVYENARSPAVFVNRSTDPPAAVPDRYDADAEPEWRKIDDGDTVRWHDHRAHWMGADEPGGIEPWVVDLAVAGEPVVVHGEFEAVAAPAWWPWLLLTIAVAATVVFAARAAWRATAITALLALVAGEVLHVAASWNDIASTFDARLGAQAMSVLAVGAASVALAKAMRRDPFHAAPWVLLATVVVGIVGAGDVLTWTRSQIPSALDPAVVRALVAIVFGGATGLAIASAARLREPAVRREQSRL